MQDLKKLLGQRIRQIRRSKNMTQEQLAELIGIGTANISYMENGKYSPSMETLAKMSEVLGVYPYEFYMFNHIKSSEEMKIELFEAIQKDEKLLKLMYKFYQSLK